MRQLVALAERVFFAPGVEVGKNPVAPPFAGHHDHRECKHDHCRDQEEHPGVDTAQKQDAHGDHGDHHKSAHIRLGQQQHAHQAYGHSHRQHSAEEALFHFHTPHHVARGIQQHRKLGQLGRLEVHDAQRDPAAGTVHAFAHVGDQHRNQQHDRRHKQPGRDLFPGGQRDLECNQRRHGGHHQRYGVAGQEVGVGITCELRVVRHGDGGRIHHDQPEHEQGHGDPQQRQVVPGHPRGRGGVAREIEPAHPHGQHVGRGFGEAADPAGEPVPQTHGFTHAAPSTNTPLSAASVSTAAQNTRARCS